MVITKRDILQHWIITKTKLKTNRAYIGYILGQVRNNFYTVDINVTEDKISIEYVGKKFGIDDLNKVELLNTYQGGNGKKILTNSNKIDYKYENNKNIWYILYTSNTSTNKNPNKQSTKSIDISEHKDILKVTRFIEKEFYDHKDFDEIYNLAVEIITNIVYYTNIKSKGNLCLWVIFNTFKYATWRVKLYGIYKIKSRGIRKRKRDGCK